MSLKCGWICNDHFVANFATESTSKRILKINQYFTKLSTGYGCLVVLTRGVVTLWIRIRISVRFRNCYVV